jgi:hypothetical protein
MFDKNVIAIFVLALIILFVWNYNTPVVEGARFNKPTRNRGQAAMIRYSAAAPASVAVPAAIATVAQTQLPVDFKEVQVYLDKLKTYSEDAQKMAESVKSTTEEYANAYEAASSNLTKLSDAAKANVDKSEEAVKKVNAIYKDITSKATDIQTQVNSNNIVKNDIDNKILTMKDINKNVSSNAIDVKNSAMNAQNSAEDARKALAGILPTAANNVVLQSSGAQSGDKVEGFTGFKSSILEGYTVYSNPDSVAGAIRAVGENPRNGPANRNAFDLENDLVDKINKFNQAYYGFLTGTFKQGTTKYSETDVNNARSTLEATISDLNAHITTKINGPNKISKDVFDASHNAVKTTAAQIDTLRADLDMKMQEIIKTKHGVPMEHTMNRDVAAYTTILWTALATSALYFVFVKMD